MSKLGVIAYRIKLKLAGLDKVGPIELPLFVVDEPIKIQHVGNRILYSWPKLEATATGEFLRQMTGTSKFSKGDELELGPFKVRVLYHDSKRDCYRVKRLI